MNERLLKPLAFFAQAKPAHEQAAHAFFDRLVAQSGIDVAANRATAASYRAQMQKVEQLDKKASRFKWLRAGLIVLAIVGVILLFVGASDADAILILIGLACAGLGFGFWFGKVNPLLKHLSEKRDEMQRVADAILAQAQAQMAPLNALFDNTDTFELLRQTMPELEFSPYYSAAHEQLLRQYHDFADTVDGDCSVLDTLAGSFCGNPLLYFRYKTCEMGTELYTGTLVISWTETYRDSDGRLRTRVRTQTLTATVEKPKPFYYVHTALGYGCQAAPSLSFSRQAAHWEEHNEKQIERKVRSGSKKLKKKAEKSLQSGGRFQEMANEKFDVMFGANDRSNEVEFRLMYTPLTQTNTVELLTDTTGFGDDFAFYKRGRYNLIRSEHAQNWTMNTSAQRYYSYDVDMARSNFVSFNNAYFKSVFFDLAPLMSVPAYLQSPTASMEVPAGAETRLTDYEFECLANAIGQGHFAHPNADTESILKTSFKTDRNGTDDVFVTAYSYYTVPRTDFVPVFGGDGRTHLVPVPWLEYLPISETRAMATRPLHLSERAFRNQPEATRDVMTPCAYLHGIFAYITQD